MKVDTIPAGPRLNALVAEKVMGWHKAEQDGTWRWRDDSDDCWPNCLASEIGTAGYKIEDAKSWSPSTDIKATFEVANRVEEDGWFLRLVGPKCLDRAGKLVDGHDALFLDFRSERLPAQAIAETEALAICRAALKAVGVSEVPDEG